jgi:hypothetical protein
LVFWLDVTPVEGVENPDEDDEPINHADVPPDRLALPAPPEGV